MFGIREIKKLPIPLHMGRKFRVATQIAAPWCDPLVSAVKGSPFDSSSTVHKVDQFPYALVLTTHQLS